MATGRAREVRVRGLARSTLEALLRWGYGEEAPAERRETRPATPNRSGAAGWGLCILFLRDACATFAGSLLQSPLSGPLSGSLSGPIPVRPPFRPPF